MKKLSFAAFSSWDAMKFWCRTLWRILDSLLVSGSPRTGAGAGAALVSMVVSRAVATASIQLSSLPAQSSWYQSAVKIRLWLYRAKFFFSSFSSSARARPAVGRYFVPWSSFLTSEGRCCLVFAGPTRRKEGFQVAMWPSTLNWLLGS